MINKKQFEEIYPLVNEIVAFSDSFANEDNPLFKYLKTRGEVYGSYIIRSNLLADLLHCYFALGYQQNYYSEYYLLFDLLQYAFWFETSNVQYFSKGFNNAKRDNDSVHFPALFIRLIEVDQLRGATYISILKKLPTHYHKTKMKIQDQKIN